MELLDILEPWTEAQTITVINRDTGRVETVPVAAWRAHTRRADDGTVIYHPQQYPRRAAALRSIKGGRP